MEVRGHERETKREKKRKAGISSASRKLMVHAHPWLKILSFPRFPSFRFRPKPSFSPYKTRFSFLYPPIALSHKFRSSFHSFFPLDFLWTFLRHCSCSSFYLLFSYSLSTCYFSRSFSFVLYIMQKRSYQRRSILCIMTSIFLLNFFCFNVSL